MQENQSLFDYSLRSFRCWSHPAVFGQVRDTAQDSIAIAFPETALQGYLAGYTAEILRGGG